MCLARRQLVKAELRSTDLRLKILYWKYMHSHSGKNTKSDFCQEQHKQMKLQHDLFIYSYILYVIKKQS